MLYKIEFQSRDLFWWEVFPATYALYVQQKLRIQVMFTWVIIGAVLHQGMFGNLTSVEW